MEHVDVMILGAGIAGLAAAHRAAELQRQAVIFEAQSSAGGLLDNFVVDGFRFDNAVHLSFATEPTVRNVFDKTEYITHPADSRCFDKGNWLKHPVQNNLYPLRAERKVELIKSFINRSNIDSPANYEEWLRTQYGDLLSETYPIAYTYKYWDTPPADLSTSWIGNRMRRAEIDEILFGALSEKTPNTYYTKEMRYPREGGYKAFIQPLIDGADIQLNCAAVNIDLAEKCVTFSDGRTVQYGKLISTLPLPVIAEIISDIPIEVKVAAKKLEATSIDLISLGFNVDIDFDLWMYIYDADILASRVYSPSKKAGSNVPSGCSSLQFEVYQRGRGPKFDRELLIENTLWAVERMGLASRENVVVTHHKRLPWGNVIFDLEMEGPRDIVKQFLARSNVSTCGRFGEWDYLWSNQSFLSGYGAL